MAPKRKPTEPAASAPATTQPAAATTTATTTSTTATAKTATAKTATPPAQTPSSTASPATGLKRGAPSQGLDQLAGDLVTQYVDKTPQQIKVVDAFLVFLVAVGGIQFLYCILAGNYPFNAFLSGFSATVGQFVLTVSLRVQTNGSYKQEFSKISPERAFADYVVCSLILHFFCVSYLN